MHDLRFLYFTDTHIRGTNPQNRKDSFLETVFVKFEEVLKIAEEKNVDAILHGGDIFDRPDISPSLVRHLVLLLNKYSLPIYAVAGNHDIYGQNLDTIKRTMLGLLDSTGIIHVLSPSDKIFFEKNDKIVQLTGQGYFYGIDHESSRKSYLVEKAPYVNYAIHIVHGMLLDKPFFDKMAYTLIDDIIETEADITLSGHYHTGFPTKVINGKYFINPGSLVRINNSIAELSRKPKITLINVESEGIKITDMYLKSAKSGEEVLDRTLVEASAFKEKKLSLFIQSIYSTGEYQTINIQRIIEELSSHQNLKSEVIKETLSRIGDAQEMLSWQQHDALL